MLTQTQVARRRAIRKHKVDRAREEFGGKVKINIVTGCNVTDNDYTDPKLNKPTEKSNGKA